MIRRPKRVAVDPARRARSAGTRALVGQLSRPPRRPDDPGEQLEPLVDSRALSLDQEADRVSALEQRRVLGRRAAASTPLVNRTAPRRSMAGGSRIEQRVLLTQLGQLWQRPFRFSGDRPSISGSQDGSNFPNPARHGKIQTRAGVHAVHTLRSAAEVLPLRDSPPGGGGQCPVTGATPALQLLVRATPRVEPEFTLGG